MHLRGFGITATI